MDPFWTFLAISAVVIITPGQDTALTVRNTLAGGRRAGLATGLGVALGQAVWAMATAVGVVAFLIASEPVFLALKLLGAGYLIYLGAQSLYAAFIGQSTAANNPVVASVSGSDSLAALRQGLLSNLGNPKMAVFFASLLPQFAPQQGPAFLPLLSLGLIFCCMTFFWLAGYAFVVGYAGNVLRRPKIRRTLEALTGTALIALGLRIAAIRD